MSGGDDLRGGNLVPSVLENAIITLREQFGVFRRHANVIQMGSDNHVIPKLASELTTYYVSELAEITKSDLTINQINLTARKLATLTTVSSELNEDSVISVAETLSRSIAQQFAYAEDEAGFNGNGTTTYGGIIGLESALLAGSVSTATGNLTFGALTAGNFEAAIGKAKLWIGSKPSWFISQAGWAASMQRLMNAAGGNDLVNLAMGPAKMFMGYPVVIVQNLTSALTGTTGLTACYFGDLQQGAYLGTRRGINVQVDPSRYFELDALAVRGTQRYDIIVHDTGTASAAGGIIKIVFG